MKFDKANRECDPQPTKQVEDESTSIGATEADFALNNPAEVNPTPDVTAFKPKHRLEKT